MIRSQVFLISFLMFFMCSEIVFGQATGNPNEQDEQYTPKGNGPLSASKKNSSSSSSSWNGDYPKNIVKFTPTALVRNLVIFSYERNFAEYFSVVGSVGFNTNKDRLFATLGSEMDIFESQRNSPNTVSISEIMRTSTHAGISPYFSISAKLFYDSYFFDNTSFFEFMYMNYSNKLNYQNTDVGAFVLSNPELKVNYSIYALKWGYQFVTEGKIKTTHEIFFTAGYRTTKYNTVVYTEDYNGVSYNYNRYYSVIPAKQSAYGLMLGMGYTFGIGFGK